MTQRYMSRPRPPTEREFQSALPDVAHATSMDLWLWEDTLHIVDHGANAGAGSTIVMNAGTRSHLERLLNTPTPQQRP